MENYTAEIILPNLDITKAWIVSGQLLHRKLMVYDGMCTLTVCGLNSLQQERNLSFAELFYTEICKECVKRLGGTLKQETGVPSIQYFPMVFTVQRNYGLFNVIW